MDISPKLIDTAETLFDRHGYMATGMDRLIEAAGMSSRTLYKHAGSKAKLMAAVLGARDRRFIQRMQVDTVDALFAALEDWVRVEGSRGCLFLRTQAETGGDVPEIAEAVAAHKIAFHRRIADTVAQDIGADHDRVLVEQVLALYEGATHAAVYRGAVAVTAARAAAAVLVERARS